VLEGTKVAVFVDSAWWHGHPSRPGQHPERWDRTIQTNMRRDERVNVELDAEGWSVVRTRDFELGRDAALAVEGVHSALNR